MLPCVFSGQIGSGLWLWLATLACYIARAPNFVARRRRSRRARRLASGASVHFTRSPFTVVRAPNPYPHSGSRLGTRLARVSRR